MKQKSYRQFAALFENLPKSILVGILVLSTFSKSYAFLRKLFSDKDVTTRAELIVVGKIEEGSLVMVDHTNNSSHEYHVGLLISEILKGKNDSNSIIASIHYGIDPVVGGGMLHTNVAKDVIELWDTGNSWKSGYPISGDIRTNNIWLLHREKHAGNGDSDWLGIYDPEDIQPLSKKDALLKYVK